jgi:hypothetical protein
MARLIKADGTNTELKPKDIKTGFRFEGELYPILATDIIQHVTLANGCVMLMDEEAQLRTTRKPFNQKATALLHLAGGRPTDQILGAVVVCEPGELH